MREADRLAVPVISLYEIGLKVRLGKWPEMAAYVESLEQRADSLPLNSPMRALPFLRD